MLTIYHLKASRSTRIIWAAEELGISYRLEAFERTPTYEAPAEFRALHPLARAPLVRDGDIVLGESGAIIDYLITRYGGGRFRPASDSADFAAYLFWLHFAEGSAMQHLMALRMMRGAGVADDANPSSRGMLRRAREDLAYADQVLATQPFLAGQEVTGADFIMESVLRFGQETLDPQLEHHPHVAAYRERIGARPAFLNALSAG
jgi:glutathione S-transferase